MTYHILAKTAVSRMPTSEGFEMYQVILRVRQTFDRVLRYTNYHGSTVTVSQ